MFPPRISSSPWQPIRMSPSAWRSLTRTSGVLRPGIHPGSPLEGVRSDLCDLRDRKTIGKMVLYTDAGRPSAGGGAPGG